MSDVDKLLESTGINLLTIIKCTINVQREILKKVKSHKVRKDFEYMSHGEILDRIAEMQVRKFP